MLSHAIRISTYIPIKNMAIMNLIYPQGHKVILSFCKFQEKALLVLKGGKNEIQKVQRHV
jgi:hypothetical protein